MISISSQAQYKVYRVNGQTIMIPDTKKELEGVGVTTVGKVTFETIKDDQGVEEKKAWIWIGGCGKTFIEDSKIFELQSGSMIRIRQKGTPKCTIQSWEKF